MLNLFNRVTNSRGVLKVWKKGGLVLIHKKGSTSDIYNYRPLTILQSMLAVYTKLLNHRLATVVETHKLLGEIQNGFRKSRSGADSGFILNTILWKVVAKKKSVHLAFLDLQKAYDSVDRPTLWKKLARMGFGGKFLETLKNLYQGDHVISEVGDVKTGPVFLGRGLRQGCSLSPLLFALYVAGLGFDLTMSQQGFLMYRICVSALFFADDIVLISRTSEGLRELLGLVPGIART